MNCAPTVEEVRNASRTTSPLNYVFSVLLAFSFRSFVGNFVDVIYVLEKAVKPGKVFDEASRRRDGRRKGALNKYPLNGERATPLPRLRRAGGVRGEAVRLGLILSTPQFPKGITTCRHVFIAIVVSLLVMDGAAAESSPILPPASFAPHIARFNAMEDENVTNLISNAQSFDWLAANIPRFECPEREVEEIYYFRLWTFRKHLKQTSNGFVFTEFLVPMRHAGAHNTISCAAGHHLAEGRWLRDARYVDDYTRFWLRGNNGRPQPHFHKFSSWFAAAVSDRYLVNGDRTFVTNLLDELVADYRVWETERRRSDGLFWQHDVQDGMEESISGSRTAKQARPTINSYMFANARAIASIAMLADREKLATEFNAKAAELKRLTQEKLWDDGAKFFKVRRENGQLADAREAIGFIPWTFGLPDPGKGYETAWAQLTDPRGFRAPFGITTTERRHPAFRMHGCCNCEWDGAVWPFATSQTLTALANVLRDYLDDARSERGSVSRSVPQDSKALRVTDPRSGTQPLPVTARDYFDAFLTYTRSHRFDGKPYIGEYLDETTGAWLKGRQARSRSYNHSTYADLLITGVIGLSPQADDVVEVRPLLPPAAWNWFCLDGVKYHGRMLTIVWDRDGSRYQRGAGLLVFADGTQIARAESLQRVTGRLP